LKTGAGYGWMPGIFWHKDQARNWTGNI
jgi:hypothetical protein